MMAFYAQTSGIQQTSSGTLAPIPGLSFTIPEGVGTSALVILNLPNPYASGSDYPGGNVAISVNGTVSPVQAFFTYSVQNPGNGGRMPTTLVVSVPLEQTGDQTIQALWASIRGSTVTIDSPATLSAILD